MPQANALTPVQDAKIEAATRLFDRYVANDQQVARYERELRAYVADHPTWSVADSAITIADRVLARPNYQPDSSGTDRDINFSIRAQFSTEVRSTIAGDPTVQRLQREEAARLERIMASDPLISYDMAVAATGPLRTSFNNDTIEAKALARAVNTLVHTTGAEAVAVAIEHGENPATLSGRNAGRYQEAKDDVVEVLRRNGVTNPSEADVTTIVQAAVPLAREAISRRDTDGNQR